ncbi:MAG: hypothetical protein Q8R50_09980 [Sediminibacterium sp.]|nr:hypothetical protein [Sediminibacterium sp.]
MTKKNLKKIGLTILVLVIIAGGFGMFMWNMPHRDVQSAKADAVLTVKKLTSEFTTDQAKANAKYLSSDGNSKILMVTGRVNSITTNQMGETVMVLKDAGAKVGVNASFTLHTSKNVALIKVDDIIKVKGAITAGNSYNADMDIYEHAVLVQCDIVK